METVVLRSKKKNDIALLISLAKKIGIETKSLSEEDVEEIGLINSIKSGRTGKFVNEKNFIESLQKKMK